MVFRRLPGFAAITFAMLFAVSVVQYLLARDDLAGKVIGELLGAPTTLLIIPYEIAIYRLVLLGEMPSHYLEQVGTERFRRFALWSLVLWATSAIPSILVNVLPVSGSSLLTFGTIGIVVSAIIFVWLLPLLPAIAVDARGASAMNALADSNGRFWFIFGSTLLPVIPLLFLVIVIIVFMAFSSVEYIPGLLASWNPLRDGILAAVGTAGITIMTAAIARVFESIGQRLK